MCPTNCSCDQLTACGKPYLKPKPLGPGSPLGFVACTLPGAAEAGQAFAAQGTQQATKLVLNATVGSKAPLCVQATGPKQYPLVLGRYAAPAGARGSAALR